MLRGYARVSSEGQSLTAQVTELKASGCERIYSEKVSGAKSDRAALHRLMREAVDGDVVVVTRLDRLARSTRDLLNILDEIGKRGAGFRSLRERAIDTTTPHGRLTISILASIAQFERELILSRMSEGRQRAKARGTKFGPKYRLNAHQRQEALSRLAAGESQSLVARTYDVDRATISRLHKRAVACV